MNKCERSNMNARILTTEDYNEIRRFRQMFYKGDKSFQENINNFVEKWENYRNILKPDEKDENFTLVDRNGNFTNLVAPRWVCHLLGLRHKSVHVLLKWNSPNLGDTFILQVRSWHKSDSPGHLDISVGGHVLLNTTSGAIESAYREMEEELGISQADLKDGQLLFKIGYEFAEERESDHFYNTEWRDVYVGEIETFSLEKIRFSDKEVVGIYLCPLTDAKNLLNQKILPIGSALKYSLSKALE